MLRKLSRKLNRKLKQCKDCPEGKLSYLFSNGRCKYHATLFKQAAKNPANPAKRTKNRSKRSGASDRRLLELELDTWISKALRISWADEEGKVTCCVSGEKVSWKEITVAHFCKRRKLATRWEEDNLRPMLVTVNSDEEMSDPALEKLLRKELGDNRVDELIYMSNQRHEPSHEWLQEQIAKYKEIYFEEKRRRQWE